jgi:hypothetical protein
MTVSEASTKKERKRQLETKAWKVVCVKCGAQPGTRERCGIHADRIRHGCFKPVPSR